MSLALSTHSFSASAGPAGPRYLGINSTPFAWGAATARLTTPGLRGFSVRRWTMTEFSADCLSRAELNVTGSAGNRVCFLRFVNENPYLGVQMGVVH